MGPTLWENKSGIFLNRTKWGRLLAVTRPSFSITTVPSTLKQTKCLWTCKIMWQQEVSIFYTTASRVLCVRVCVCQLSRNSRSMPFTWGFQRSLWFVLKRLRLACVSDLMQAIMHISYNRRSTSVRSEPRWEYVCGTGPDIYLWK